MNKHFLSMILAVTLMGLSIHVQAAVISLIANMDGTQANAGAGTGSSGIGVATLLYDDISNELDWEVQWENLAGEVSVAHFHGPAAANENVGPQVTIGTANNPSVGNAILTGQQEIDLLEGLWYVNIHSTENPGGDIRGQVHVVPVPAAAILMLSGLFGLGLLKNRNS